MSRTAALLARRKSTAGVSNLTTVDGGESIYFYLHPHQLQPHAARNSGLADIAVGRFKMTSAKYVSNYRGHDLSCRNQIGR